MLGPTVRVNLGQGRPFAHHEARRDRVGTATTGNGELSYAACWMSDRARIPRPALKVCASEEPTALEYATRRFQIQRLIATRRLEAGIWRGMMRTAQKSLAQ